MKSSTFSLFAIGFVLAAYGGMAFLENRTRYDGQQITDSERSADNNRTAREACPNSDWDMVEKDGRIDSIRCIRRKPLNGAKVKP